MPRGKWRPQGQWVTDRGIVELIEQEGFGIVGGWLSVTGEGETAEICQAVNDHGELLTILKDLMRYCVTPGGFPDKGKGRTERQQSAFDAANTAIVKAAYGWANTTATEETVQAAAAEALSLERLQEVNAKLLAACLAAKPVLIEADEQWGDSLNCYSDALEITDEAIAFAKAHT